MDYDLFLIVPGAILLIVLVIALFAGLVWAIKDLLKHRSDKRRIW